MNADTLGAAVIAAKTLSDTAAGRAETAAERAETAAETAALHGYELNIVDHGIVISEGGGNS